MARKKSKQSIAIYVNGKPVFNDNKKPKNLIEVFESRLRSQDRVGNDSGTLYFSPRILSHLMTKYDEAYGKKGYVKSGSFTKWIENTLKSVYFELMSGEIVPLSAISKLHLISSKQQEQVENSKDWCPQKNSLKLSNFQIGDIPQQHSSHKPTMYEVYICRKDSDEKEPVYLGDKLNLLEDGLRDLTLDHVVTTYDMREQYHEDLAYIAKIDALIRYFLPKDEKFEKNRSSIAKNIEYIIDFNDETALNKLKEELDLIVRATRGIRVCSKRVNKLSV